jgi:hypothetical protein
MYEKECLYLLNRFIINQYDYDRMIGYDCNNIDPNLSYDDFVEWNVKCLKEYKDEDYVFFKYLCDKMNQNKIGQMDMETCVVFTTTNIFFDINKNLIIVNPR